MQQHPQYTRNRISQMIDRLKGKIYAQTLDVEELQISPPVERISYAEAQQLEYEPVGPGRQLGPLWTTFWFRGSIDVPRDWSGQQVDFLWDSHSEATLWIGGRTVGGLNPGRSEVPLEEEIVEHGHLKFQVEVACNGLFGHVGRHYKTVEAFVLDRCAIGRFDPEAWELYYDLLVLCELEKQEGMDADWSGRLLADLNRVANLLDIDDPNSWPAVRKIVAELYENRNGSYRHQLSAIGHAHMDTAWLWPLEETWRKCTRTFSTATLYMDHYPEYKFACSQAVQYEEMKTRNPDLYHRIKEKFNTGQWVPVGGTWVEPDCNVPSGEALCRQFLFGQRFFQKEFGAYCHEFWNPDVFGYNGQLPQIMKESGVRYFLTQKLSWNHFNKPDHQTFAWQGIDGSEVLTHFPPANSYNSVATIEELRRVVRSYKDSDRSGESYMLFGVGDGGGGPTRDMLERLRRAKDLQGLPRTEVRSSNEFFKRLEKDCQDLPRVIGELYFELHRGTYTTQAATKKGNRKGEFLLHDAEFLAVLAQRLQDASYPKDELDVLWKTLLVNQFHDILPGSSIRLVYEDAERDYAKIQAEGGKLCEAALAALGGGDTEKPVNTTSFERHEVAEKGDGSLVFVDVPAYGIGRIGETADEVTIEEGEDQVVLENFQLRAVLSSDGSLVSLVEKDVEREALSGIGNQFLIYDDHPTAWDAWEIDPFALETAKACPPADSCAVVTRSPLRAEIEFSRKIGKESSLVQKVRLDAGARRLEFHTEVDWHESDKMLKVAFPVNARSLNATYEMQFGHVERPTHYNNSFDLAKFEVPGHKWADLSEYGFGVSLLTDCKYGYHTFGNSMHITLLRAPKAPDPEADMGAHSFAYAIYPHQGSWQEAGLVAEGYSFNAPLRWAASLSEPVSYFAVGDPNLVLDTVKKAEDSEGLLLRLYEAHGARGVAELTPALPFKSAVCCNILEESGEELQVIDGKILIPYRPHQIISILLK
jgi:alpha-mannosidase